MAGVHCDSGRGRDSNSDSDSERQVSKTQTGAGTGASVERERDRPVNRQGMAASGLYPHVSRTKLARALGMDVSTVSGYLAGRTPLRLRDALRVAELVGVGVEELNEALGKAQVGYAKRRVARAKAKVRKMTAATKARVRKEIERT